MIRIVCTILILTAGATACWQTDDEPTTASHVAPIATSTPHPIRTATPSPSVFEGPTSASNIPFPKAVPTSTPTPGQSPLSSMTTVLEQTIEQVVVIGMTALILIPIGLLVLGILWSPFAALICNRIAHHRKLTGEYEGTGAGYSAVFLLPWCYLVLRMLGRRPSESLVRAVYGGLYFWWLALVAGYGTFWYTEANFFGWRKMEIYGLGQAIWQTIFWFALIAAQLGHLGFSVWSLRETHARVRRYVPTSTEFNPDVAYIYPFIFFLAWMVVFPIAWFFTAQSVFSS